MLSDFSYYKSGQLRFLSGIRFSLTNETLLCFFVTVATRRQISQPIESELSVTKIRLRRYPDKCGGITEVKESQEIGGNHKGGFQRSQGGLSKVTIPPRISRGAVTGKGMEM